MYFQSFQEFIPVTHKELGFKNLRNQVEGLSHFKDIKNLQWHPIYMHPLMSARWCNTSPKLNHAEKEIIIVLGNVVGVIV